MDFWEFLRILGRRWYVVVPLLVATAGLALTLPGRVPPTYTATGSILVVGTSTPSEADANPFRAVGLGANAEALALLAEDEASRQAVESAGLSPTYTVEQVSLNSPTLVVEAEAPSAAQASETVDFVLDQITARFEALQAGALVAPTAFLQAQRLTGEPQPTAVYTGQTRTLVLIAVIGLLGAALGALAVEGLSLRSRSRSRDSRPRSTSGREARRRGEAGSSAGTVASRQAREASDEAPLEHHELERQPAL